MKFALTRKKTKNVYYVYITTSYRDVGTGSPDKVYWQRFGPEEALLKASDDAWVKASATDDSRILGEDEIASVVSMMTNIPVHRVSTSEGERLLTMAGNLKKQIIGQDDAVEAVVKAIQRNRAGLRNPAKPVGTFIFLGPTGVGKTYLAKKLAEYMFDSEENLIRIDVADTGDKTLIQKDFLDRFLPSFQVISAVSQGKRSVKRFRTQIPEHRIIILLFDRFHPAELTHVVVTQLPAVTQVKDHMIVLIKRYIRILQEELAFHAKMADQSHIIHQKQQILASSLKEAEMLADQGRSE